MWQLRPKSPNLILAPTRTSLKAHTPRIRGVKISPPELREWAPKSTVKQVIFEDSPPKIWGVNLHPLNLGGMGSQGCTSVKRNQLSFWPFFFWAVLGVKNWTSSFWNVVLRGEIASWGRNAFAPCAPFPDCSGCVCTGEAKYCRDQNYSGSGKTFPGINFWKITDFLWDGSCLELIIVSSNFQTLLLLQDKLLESVWKRLISVKRSWKLLDPPFSELIQ